MFGNETVAFAPFLDLCWFTNKVGWGKWEAYQGNPRSMLHTVQKYVLAHAMLKLWQITCKINSRMSDRELSSSLFASELMFLCSGDSTWNKWKPVFYLAQLSHGNQGLPTEWSGGNTKNKRWNILSEGKREHIPGPVSLGKGPHCLSSHRWSLDL